MGTRRYAGFFRVGFFPESLPKGLAAGSGKDSEILGGLALGGRPRGFASVGVGGLTVGSANAVQSTPRADARSWTVCQLG